MSVMEFGDSVVNDVVFGDDGLVVTVIQERQSHDVLMVAYMNQESLMKTLETGRTWFWSRSRKEFWCKGETSGDRQYVRAIRYDCDGDALLIEIDQHGNGACHTGERSCFYRDLATGPGDGTAG